MRTKFPTSLEEDELIEYIKYLGFVGGMFVLVAVILYVTVIVLAISSKKAKCLNSEVLAEKLEKYRKLHASRAHYYFIALTLFVCLIAIISVIFGLVENDRLHERIVIIAQKPTTVIPPTEQVILNINETVGETAISLDESILLVEQVLLSVASISDSLNNIHNSILDVQNQFFEIRDQVQNATSQLGETQDGLKKLNEYQDQGYISGVPDTSQVQNVNDTIDQTLDSANDFLNKTVTTISDVLDEVNDTIADAVETGTKQVAKAKDTLRDQVANMEERLDNAVDSLRGPNRTIADVSKGAIRFENMRYKLLIVILVIALIPLILIFIGLGVKITILYKFAFGLAFVCMFWLIALGGVFTVVHTAFSQACEYREVLVINGIHKFTPDQYNIDLGDLSVGGDSNITRNDTKIVIALNQTTLHALLECVNPTNFFDVFGLDSLITAVFGQIYKSLDELEEQQAKIFANNNSGFNFNNQINETGNGVNGFANATDKLVNGDFERVYGLEKDMYNITNQAKGLVIQANQSVDSAITQVNGVTQNVTTNQGGVYSFFYTVSNITGFDPATYPFNDAVPEIATQLDEANQNLQQALSGQTDMTDIFNSITSTTGNILANINKFQGFLNQSLNISLDFNASIAEIQTEIDTVSALMPQIYENISIAIDSIRAVLNSVGNKLRTDTQCGFASDFYISFSEEICITSTSNAQAMAAALLLMGISYFMVCLLGVGLLKRHDVRRLIQITEKGLARIRSLPVITHTVTAVNVIVRTTSEMIRNVTPGHTPRTPRPPRSPRSPPDFSNIGNMTSRSNTDEEIDSVPPTTRDRAHSTTRGRNSPRTSRASYLHPSHLTVPTPEERGSSSSPRSPPVEEARSPVQRSSSIAKMSAMITSLHKRASSLTSANIVPAAIARGLGVSQEIPYTELQDVSSSDGVRSGESSLTTSLDLNASGGAQDSNNNNNSNSSEGNNNESTDNKNNPSLDMSGDMDEQK